MRMNSALVERTLLQFSAQVIPESHPALPQLTRLFGEHTFFLDSQGLKIVEPVEETLEGVQVAKVVEIASWTDANPPGLKPHEPESTDVVVVLGTEH